ncbi:MAG: rRNA cytosine-C5-methyltransferase [Bacteroidales bacterium]|nr:rRNA cytosine-C5-methyltransferase [Bacteroidales bacterium]
MDLTYNMLPENFIERLKSQEYINNVALQQAFKEPSPVSIRINPLKWTLKPLDAGSVPWCNDGFYLDTRPSYTLDPLFHAGCYYPQEASGMFLEQVFRQTADQTDYIRVLDLCGAPGGKSTHLSSLIGQKGLLVANEVIRTRARILEENLTKWGLSNCIVTQNDPSSFSLLPGFFDLILLDVPCSGEGMFRDQVAIKEWSEENTALCAERQKRIIMDVWPSLKENGILIYSTCTFNPGENEKNIKWLTGKQDAEIIRLDISDFKGITEIDFEGIYGYGFYPGKIRGEGLFISVLRKSGKETDLRTGDKWGSDRKINREERIAAGEWTSLPEESFVRYGNEIVSVAGSYNDYIHLVKHLNVIKPGTKVLAVKAKNFIPAHEMAMSVYFKKESFPDVRASQDKALHYLCRENILVEASSKGWNTVSFNGIILGFLNNIGKRVNNYYPVEWRIRMNISNVSLDNVIKWRD